MVIFTSNALSVRFFAETEFWFSFIKVAAIVLFILIGGCAVFGVLPIQGYDHAPLFENFVKDGLFPNGWMPVFTTMLTVNFAFSGTELIGVTAGETKDPDKAIPKAIHTTLFRLVIFFIGSIVVMASLIPWQDAGVDESPFVLVFNSIGLPFAGDVMNFVVLTAILSAANSGLYASTRMLWSLANEDMIPHNIAKTNSRGVPMTALRLSMIGGLLALLSSVVAASTVYLVLVSVSGLAVVIRVLPAIRAIRQVTDKPIIVYPNNGDIYDPKTKTWSPNPTGSEPAFAHLVPQWIDAGARLIGGCCRTTPDDIRTIAHAASANV